MDRIVSVTATDEKNGTTVHVLGNGQIPDCMTKALESPPRIVVDIFSAAKPFQSMTIPAKSANIKSIRMGHHPKRIRLVIDIKGADLPIFKTMSSNNGLTILLRTREPEKEKMGESPQDRPRLPHKEIPLMEQLTQIGAHDGEDDTTLFSKGVNEYRDQNWAGAIENLNHLVTTYPTGRYTERAYFLLAKSYEQLRSDSVLTHFAEIKRHYEDAINRFPNATYVPDALLSIGNLCFKAKNYHEALGYYNLVYKKDEDSITALRALVQKARIFSLKKKRGDALSVLKTVVSRYPDSPERTEAKMEMSKLLYEMNSFHKSLKALSELNTTNPENIFQYPEISLYLGYNYYQLGDHTKARENLFRFYNSSPDSELNHLVFTKIADTYRDEGFIQNGVKLYQLVLQRYPDTEGALISRIRLAEHLEEGELQVNRGITKPVNVIGPEIGLPREIYEDVMNSLLKKDKKNPLAQLALLKLAMLYQKEKEYDKSLKSLKDLIKEHPWTTLRKESKQVLLETIEAILNEEMARKRYVNIINIYQREKDLFSMINAPGPFLTVARASLRLNLEDMATDVFRRADVLLPDKEKPSDLLFLTGKDLFRKQELKNSLARLDLLIAKYPSDKNAPRAYQLKGRILSQQKKYPQAAGMFSSALRYDLRRCERAGIFVHQAKALMESRANEKALKATREADALKGICHMSHPHIYEEIGDLYFHLGHPQKALSIFQQALEIEKERENSIVLKFKMAQCYRLLDKSEEFLALYNEISSLDDPFWSNLAKERIDEIKFKGEMEENRKGAEKRG